MQFWSPEDPTRSPGALPCYLFQKPQ